MKTIQELMDEDITLEEILITYDNITISLQELHKQYDNTLRTLEAQQQILDYIIQDKLDSNKRQCNCKH